jgi:eukaryotic-like serine/threonine-protein kinase
MAGEQMEFRGQDHTYTVVSRGPLAYGRVSVLYLAQVDRGDRAVCIKLIRTQTPGKKRDYSEFLSEVQARRLLVHPSILPILDLGIDKVNEGGEPFLVFPHCEGGNLRALLAHRSYVPVLEAVPILRAVAAALDFAHARGIVHGDVKPENILFPQKGRSDAVLSDFGMSVHFAHIEELSSSTVEDRGGSSAYLAPEQISSAIQSTRSDIYSFATVAYEMLAGRRPVDEGAPAFKQMLAKVKGELIAPQAHNPSLPDIVCEALLWGLTLEPKERPLSATQLCEVLEGRLALGHARQAVEAARGSEPARIELSPSSWLTSAPDARLPKRAQMSSKQKAAVWVAIVTTIGSTAAAVINAVWQSSPK